MNRKINISKTIKVIDILQNKKYKSTEELLQDIKVEKESKYLQNIMVSIEMFAQNTIKNLNDNNIKNRNENAKINKVLLSYPDMMTNDTYIKMAYLEHFAGFDFSVTLNEYMKLNTLRNKYSLEATKFILPSYEETQRLIFELFDDFSFDFDFDTIIKDIENKCKFKFDNYYKYINDEIKIKITQVNEDIKFTTLSEINNKLTLLNSMTNTNNIIMNTTIDSVSEFVGIIQVLFEKGKDLLGNNFNVEQISEQLKNINMDDFKDISIDELMGNLNKVMDEDK